jgi:hypothetical protein
MLDPLEIYAIAFAGTFVLLVCSRMVELVRQLVESSGIIFAKYVKYPYILHRRQWLGPWTRITVLRQFLYISVNIFLVCWQTDKTSAGQHAGALALINMVPLYLALHHSYGADQLNVYLSTFRSIHRATSLTTAIMSAIHVLIFIRHNLKVSWSTPINLYGLTVRNTARLWQMGQKS